jgi:hypothetical protein
MKMALKYDGMALAARAFIGKKRMDSEPRFLVPHRQGKPRKRT